MSLHQYVGRADMEASAREWLQSQGCLKNSSRIAFDLSE
jgi:hypothetical protein